MTPEDDSWCVAVDMGSFDLIVVESRHFHTCDSYRSVNQHLYRDELQIKLRSQLRELLENWTSMEICVSSRVRGPQRATEEIKS